jgi:uncharacterized protein (DUF1800 family)
MSDLSVATAAWRFGYGLPVAGGFASPAELMTQLRKPPAPPSGQEAPGSAERVSAFSAYQDKITASKGTPEELTQLKLQREKFVSGAYRADCYSRIAAAVQSASPFVERLVDFWSNHFTVSRPAGRYLGLPFLNEAIRSHITGRFEDLLIAAEHHPAMVEYLNLNQSFGPNSVAGKRQGHGLNENLAREILELHTIGVDGGYNQQDIVNFAKLMTGWTINRQSGGVEFKPNRAEPGVHDVLGKAFGSEVPQAESYSEVLRMLARSPAATRFIARKLVVHFIGDPPPESAVAALANAYQAGAGDLPKVYEALVNLPESWQRPGAKARTDFEFVVAALRASGIPATELAPKEANGNLRPNPLGEGALKRLSQPLWSAPSPAGWPERPEEWLSPTGLSQRLQWIGNLVHKIPDESPTAFCDKVLGPLASPRTRAIVEAASNREEGLALVLASPEFNRR